MIKLYKIATLDIIVNSILIMIGIIVLSLPIIHFIILNYQINHKEQNINIPYKENNYDQSTMIDFAIEYYIS